MKSAPRLTALFLALLLLGTSGCGTIYNLAGSPGGPTMFGGVAWDIELLGPEGKDRGGAVVLVPFDLVLSFGMDIVTLPVTMMCGFFGWQRKSTDR